MSHITCLEISLIGQLGLNQTSLNQTLRNLKSSHGVLRSEKTRFEIANQTDKKSTHETPSFVKGNFLNITFSSLL